MSDAQGSNDEPTTGEPASPSPAERPDEALADAQPDTGVDETGVDADLPPHVAPEPPSDEPEPHEASIADERDAVDPLPSEEPTPLADEALRSAPAGDEPSADAEDEAAQSFPEPAVSRPAPEPPATRGADVADEASADADPVDYEALAAELDRLEAQSGDSFGASADPDDEPVDATPTEVAPAEPSYRVAQATTPPVAEPVSDPVVTPSEPTPLGAASPIFVQAPEPPKKRGNRGAAALIGLLAAAVFAVLFFAASFGIWWMYGHFGLREGVADQPLVDLALEVATAPPFWVTVIGFWIGFWLLGVFVNRARWWSWVVLGVVVSLIAYGGYLGGVFLEAPFWMITQSEGVTLLLGHVLSPIGLAAFLIAREVTIWFGAWVSRRGVRLAALNAEAQDEYDRLIAEGPRGPESA